MQIGVGRCFDPLNGVHCKQFPGAPAPENYRFTGAAPENYKLSDPQIKSPMETPLPYEPPVVSAELTKSHARQWWRAHVVAIAFFVPFFIMLVLHRFLGLSDALMAAPAPGQPDSFLYNIIMVGAIYFGVAGYIFHALALSRKEPGWVFFKLALLIVIWAVLISAMP